jgi:hypothetical protein
MSCVNTTEQSRLYTGHFTAVKHSTLKGAFKCVKQRLPYPLAVCPVHLD